MLVRKPFRPIFPENLTRNILFPHFFSLIDLNITKKTLHEDYNPRTFDNDIAILTLNEPVTFSEAISPICLPSQMVTGLETITKSKFSDNFTFVGMISH